MSETKMKIIYNTVKYSIICLIVLFLSILCVQYVRIANLKSEKSSLENSLNSLISQEEQLSQEIDDITDEDGELEDQFLDEYARENGYGKEGETVYIGK